MERLGDPVMTTLSNVVEAGLMERAGCRSTTPSIMDSILQVGSSNVKRITKPVFTATAY
jgi:hypothetical protein